MALPDNIPQDAGRPPALVRFNVKRDIIDALEHGGSYEMAAKHAGISESTFYNYLKKGKEARDLREEEGEEALGVWDPYYIDLVEAIEEREYEIQRELLKSIKDDPAWTAKAWILERRYGWTKQDTVRHEGAGGGPIEHTVTLDLGDKEIDTDPEPDDTITDADWEYADDDPEGQ